jgi:WD40 repeat protein
LDCLAFSPNGKFLVSGGFDPSLCFWDLDTGKELRRFVGPGEVSALVFSPEGRLLAAGGGKQIILLNSATSKALVRLKGDSPGWIRAVAFSRNGKVLVSATEDGLACLWDVPTGKKLREFNFQPVDGGWCALAPDASKLAVVDKEHVIHLWDVATGKESGTFRTKAPHGRLPVFSSDGKTLAFGDGEAIVLWDTTTGQARLKLNGCCHARAWTFSPDGTALAVGMGSGSPQSITLWDTTSGKRRPAFKTEPVHVDSLSFSPNGKILAATQWACGTIQLWDAATGKELHQRPGHGSSIIDLKFLTDGKTLVSAGWGENVRLWERATSKQLRCLDPGSDSLFRLALAPDEKQLALGSSGDDVDLCRLADGKKLGKISWDRGTIFGLAFSSDGQCFVCGSESLNVSFIGVHDIVSRKLLWDFRVPHLVNSMVLSPDDRTLILGGVGETGGMVSLFDAKQKKLRLELRVAEIRIDAVAVSPDGKTFAVRGDRPVVTLWDTVSGKLRLELVQADEVSSIAFSPDGKTLAVGTRKGVIDVWETASGKLRSRFAVPHGPVPCVAFSPEGRVLASGHADHTILIWDVTGRSKDGSLPSAPLTEKELNSLWNELPSSDGLKAHRAIWRLIAGSKQSVPFLKKQLPPLAAPDAVAMKRLLADLDADQFTLRQKATEALMKLDDRARHSLEQVLRGKPTLEVRKRVELLLKRLDEAATPPQAWRGLRAVEVLEQIGTVEARQLLTALAKGLPGARLTQEAQASLKRLAKRAVATP